MRSDKIGVLEFFVFSGYGNQIFFKKERDSKQKKRR